MASAREIKRRMRSVKNIRQVTMALEAVSASKVRRATTQVTASRAYSSLAVDILTSIAHGNRGTVLHPLLTVREGVGTVTVLLITSDRGLAGAYNANITRVARRFVHDIHKPIRWVAAGRKGRDALLRTKENLIAEFSPVPSTVDLHFVRPIARLLIDEYLNGTCDEVYIAYTDFVNTLTQKPRVQRLLPLLPDTASALGGTDYFKPRQAPTNIAPEYIYEPSAEGILDEIVPKFTEMVVFQSILEAVASEHSARMVAMRNASDNAKELVDELQLSYNKARQAGITSEILDIVGGSEALKTTKSGGNGNGKQSIVEAAQAVLDRGSSAAGGDDLTRLEGIGPKMSAALKSAGLDSFTKLSKASLDQIKSAIEAAGMHLAPAAESWAEQAALAASGNWAGLKKLQDELVGGRRVK